MSYADTVLKDTPSLYWRLGASGATDQSGNGRNGTAAGGVTIGGGAGLLTRDADASTQFDGVDDRITSTYNPFANSTTRSFEGWAYRDTSTTIDCLFGGSATNHPLLRADSATTQLSWFPTSAGAAVSWAVVFPTAQINHWVLVFNETTDVAELYINGISQGTKTQAAAYNATPGNLLVGARATSTDPFVGRIDEFAVYEYGLTAAQVLNHYNVGIGLVSLPPTPRRRPTALHLLNR